jgi:hypothetical protein
MSSWLTILQIMMAADEVGIPAPLLYSICHTETRIRNVVNKYDGGSPSYGYCQVKLRTARQFFPKWAAKDLMSPYKNFLVAASYLKYQEERFKTTLKAISSYNAGRPITGNKKYVGKVLAQLAKFE